MDGRRQIALNFPMHRMPLPHFEDRKRIWLGRLCKGAALAGSALLAVHAIGDHARSQHQAADGVKGDLRIVGSHVMEQPVRHWIAIFSRDYPNVTIHAALYGSGVAANELAEGRADVVPLARPMNEGERVLFSRRTPPPVAIRVGTVPDAPPSADRIDTALFRKKNVGSDCLDPLYLYLPASTSAQGRRLALAFVAVALSRDGQAAIARAQLDPLSVGARQRAIVELGQLAKQGDAGLRSNTGSMPTREKQRCA